VESAVDAAGLGSPMMQKGFAERFAWESVDAWNAHDYVEWSA
jgi:hypothetical protein